MPSPPNYLTPLQLAVLAWPASVRPEELGPGRTSLIVPTLTGTGTMQVTGTAFDAHQVKLVIVHPGAPGVATYQYWTDGATLGDETLTAADGSEQALWHTAVDELTGGADTGIRVIFGGTTFSAGDQWVWSTKPVQAIVAANLAASADAKSLVSGPDPTGGGRYVGDLEPLGGLAHLDIGFLHNVAVLSRLKLAERRGLDPASADGRLYIDSAKRARAELIEIPNKQRHPLLGGSAPDRARPVIYRGEDRYGVSSAARSRLINPEGDFASGQLPAEER